MADKMQSADAKKKLLIIKKNEEKQLAFARKKIFMKKS